MMRVNEKILLAVAFPLVIFSREIGTFLDYHFPFPGYTGPTRKSTKAALAPVVTAVDFNNAFLEARRNLMKEDEQ